MGEEAGNNAWPEARQTAQGRREHHQRGAPVDVHSPNEVMGGYLRLASGNVDEILLRRREQQQIREKLSIFLCPGLADSLTEKQSMVRLGAVGEKTNK